MGGYLVNFSVYTMAMIGLIFFALMVYKKFCAGGLYSRKSDFLGVEDMINIAPRKNLYIIRAGKEKFLIAGDVDKTTLISKLDDTPSGIDGSVVRPETAVRKMHTAGSVDELPSIQTFKQSGKKSDVLHNMVRKINR